MAAEEEIPLEDARRIDRLCSQFEQAWRTGEPVHLEEYLERWDGDAAFLHHLFEELLRLELETLEQADVVPTIPQYAERFPEYLESLHKVFAERVEPSEVFEQTRVFHAPEGSVENEKSATDKIGRYLIERKIGQGAFGVVYLARDPQLDCFVAIKQLNIGKVVAKSGASQSQLSEVVGNLLREVRLAAKLRKYQGIVTVLDVIPLPDEESAEEIYFVQEYIDGGDLKTLLKQEAISPTETARLLQLVAEAISHMHQHGIYHRDLKPANIILDQSGNPFVVDFGLAVDEKIQKKLRGEISGTWPYMAPEQIRGEVHLLDGRADIWALGVMLYEMLTRRRPFQGESILEFSDGICHRDPKPPRMINPQLPAELERICLKCLSKRMTDRYSTASDVSEDLRQWLLTKESGFPSTSSEPQHAVMVIPKGLRSFDESDADFFLELLPGPRDREGVPDSIRFWKQRIEEKDADETFRVGLLYGPSGCGKSSLVKAGLLPSLNLVAPVYVESTAVDTEARIFRQLRKAAPRLPQHVTLPEAIVLLRENPDLSGFKKVVLILDQFEQWLQARRTFGREQLIEALRQCDGARVQTLILVRDDFWMAVTRFLHELEVDLVPGENVAGVDLFPPDHGRKVLTSFGRAYGKIEDDAEPTPEQRAFIEKVVEGLSVDGTIVCVRLAIFADMVKSKDWNPSTIEQVGGTDGVGESFLEEAFVSRTANPQHRLHQQAARNVLQALLPEVGTNIKGHMKSYTQLLDVSGYQQKPEEFHEVLRILDSELRMITPTDPEGIESDHSRDLDSNYFQLTHDFLVPSLRDWLTRSQRATRKGRAQLLLAELTETWRQKPESRNLPGPLEWMSIIWWTSGSERTEAQQNMVSKTTRKIARNVGLLGLGLVLALFIAVQSNGRFQSGAAVNRLINADTNDIPLIMDDIKNYQSLTKTRLIQELSSRNANPDPLDSSEAERNRRQVTHLELALAVLDPAHTPAVFNRLDEVPIENLQVVASLLKPHGRQIADDLWKRFSESKSQPNVSGLRIAAVLATITPSDQRWDQEAIFLVDQLLTIRTGEAVLWQQLFRPIASNLSRTLVARASSENEMTHSQRAMLTDFIADYAADSPDLLVDTIETANHDVLVQLLSKLDHHSDRALNLVNVRLQALEPDEATADPVSLLGEKLASSVAQAEGIVGNRGLIVQRLPRNRFDALNELLREAGFTLTSLRPYLDRKELLVAAGWQRGAKLTQIHWDLSLDQIAQSDQQMRDRGFLPIDFERYPSPDSSDMKWVVLWAESQGSSPETRFVTSTTASEFRKHVEEWPQERFSITRFSIWLAEDGAPRCTAIWNQGTNVVTDSFADWRYERAFGDLSPGTLQSDLRFELIPPQQRDRIGIFKQLSIAQDLADTTSSEAERDNKLLAVSKYYSLMGDYAKSRAILAELYPRWKRSSLIYEYFGLIDARTGNQEKLTAAIEAYSSLSKASPAVTGYLRLRAAILEEDETEIHEALENLKTIDPKSAELTEMLARGYSTLVSIEKNPDLQKELVEQSLFQLKELITDGQVDLPDVLMFDVDFDPIRDTPQFRQYMQELGLNQRMAVAYAQSNDCESKQLWNLAPQEHLEQAEELLNQGFHPTVVTVRVDPAEQNSICASVWHRQVEDVDAKVKLARRKANLLMTAARFGDESGFREALLTEGSSDLRSRLTLYAAKVLPIAGLLENLQVAEDTRQIQSFILMLGSLPAEQIEAELLNRVVEQIRQFTLNEHSSVRSAALWTLQQWDAATVSQSGPLDKTPSEFRNAAAQRMLIVDPPDRFLMGSRQTEKYRGEQETQYWVNIPRTYALAATETTKAEFLKFLEDEKVKKHYARKEDRFGLLKPEDRTPMVGVQWQDAAKFCQWLSELDPEISESDYCYPGIWDVDAEQIALPENYLQRRGYRLPTEAEWEFAARAGEVDAIRACGDDDSLLAGYEWYGGNSREGAHPASQLRPNQFGFYDLMGNVNEWCDDIQDAYRRPLDGFIRLDATGNKFLPVDSDFCVVRGGSFLQSLSELRSANRSFQLAKYRSSSFGFRVCRTWVVPKD